MKTQGLQDKLENCNCANTYQECLACANDQHDEHCQPLYKPTYQLDRVDYQHVIRKTGEEVKMMVFYKTDEHMIENPPDHTKTIDKLLKLLKGTGIGKITITFLDKNQSHPKKEEEK